VILDNVRSAHNVGAIFRTIDCAGMAGIELCGLTPHPPNPKLAKTALGAERSVPWRRAESALEAIERARAQDRRIVAIEAIDSARDLYDSALGDDCALVLGHEVFGITPEALAAADLVVRIPMRGSKSSLNVASAFAVVAFELLRRSRRSGETAE